MSIQEANSVPHRQPFADARDSRALQRPPKCRSETRAHAYAPLACRGVLHHRLDARRARPCERSTATPRPEGVSSGAPEARRGAGTRRACRTTTTAASWMTARPAMGHPQTEAGWGGRGKPPVAAAPRPCSAPPQGLEAPAGGRGGARRRPAATTLRALRPRLLGPGGLVGHPGVGKRSRRTPRRRTVPEKPVAPLSAHRPSTPTPLAAWWQAANRPKSPPGMQLLFSPIGAPPRRAAARCCTPPALTGAHSVYGVAPEGCRAHARRHRPGPLPRHIAGAIEALCARRGKNTQARPVHRPTAVRPKSPLSVVVAARSASAARPAG